MVCGTNLLSMYRPSSRLSLSAAGGGGTGRGSTSSSNCSGLGPRASFSDGRRALATVLTLRLASGELVKRSADVLGGHVAMARVWGACIAILSDTP
jgi:hypothetical protein